MVTSVKVPLKTKKCESFNRKAMAIPDAKLLHQECFHDWSLLRDVDRPLPVCNQSKFIQRIWRDNLASKIPSNGLNFQEKFINGLFVTKTVTIETMKISLFHFKFKKSTFLKASL